ncbi:hypothetical protein [Haloarcula sp. K1]|uniref:hypothetical protein n=1 Tax=Haloarcula sp. K1 TaxID=1622207 RepID=UPI000AEAF334|nr:hypothetical protein [Haloarcula sp. K1]
MLARKPSTLSDAELDYFSEMYNSFDHKIRQFADEITEELPSETASSQVAAIAFSPNDALPKREARPTRRIAYLAEQLYLAQEDNDDHLAPLLKFTILMQEYYDITDDIIDGDVAAGSEANVFLTLQYLMPALTKYLTRIGVNTTAYWSEQAIQMVDCFRDELVSEPSPEVYLDLLEKQALLYSTVTGLCGLISGGDAALVNRYETIGNLYFKHEQLLLDGYQFGEESYPWNAWELLPEEEAMTLFKELRTELNTALDILPASRRKRVRPLISIDVSTWAKQQLAD